MSFFIKKNQKKLCNNGDEQEIIDEIVETEEVVTKADVDVNALLVTANLENGKKIAKQCSACHSFDNSMKIKVGPPMEYCRKRSASIDGFKYSKALTDYKKIGRSTNFLFL